MPYPKEKDGLKIGLGFDAKLIITIQLTVTGSMYWKALNLRIKTRKYMYSYINMIMG